MRHTCYYFIESTYYIKEVNGPCKGHFAKEGGVVRITTLSDHAADKLQEREAQRELQYKKDLEAHEGRLQARQERIDGRKALMGEAWKQGRCVLVVGCALAMAWHRMRKAIEGMSRPVKGLPGVEDHIWLQGQEGENGLAELLAQCLTDEWTLLKGYRNRKGEIDEILVGPGGICAIEVKNLKGTISCDGDEWVRDKRDKWGNLVRANEPIVDKGGRSPSRQVNESADLLEAFLKKSLPCRIRRYVVFTNVDAEFGHLRNLTVDGVFLMKDWDPGEMLRQGAAALTVREVGLMVGQITHDHHHGQRRRKP
jgi:hypothetical protein